MTAVQDFRQHDYYTQKPPAALPSLPAAMYTDPQLDHGNGEDTSLHLRKTRSRSNSLRQIFRRGPSETRSQSQQPPPLRVYSNNSNNALATTQTTRAPNTTAAEGDTKVSAITTTNRSASGTRKRPFDAGTMLRKISTSMRSTSGQEQQRLEQERLARLHQPAPSLPLHSPLPVINTESFSSKQQPTSPPLSPSRNFSRPNAMPPLSSNGDNSSSSPAYALRTSQQLSSSSSPAADPRGRTNGEYVPYVKQFSRNESITNRGRSSYSSSMIGGNVSSPRRVRRRKDPTPFNILVIGAKNSGKTSLISFLRETLAAPVPGHTTPESTIGGSRSSFTSNYLETELDGERIGLTIWDSAGLERNIVDLQLRELTTFIESKFEETFAEEQKVVRSPGVKDPHIHCVFLILDPLSLDTNIATSTAQQKNGVTLSSATGLDDEINLQAMRSFWGKTTIIPIIAKADTLTIAHMAFLKRTVWASIKSAHLDPLEALELEDEPVEDSPDEDSDDYSSVLEQYNANNTNTTTTDADSDPKATRKAHNRQSSLSATMKSADDEAPYIPMSIISPDPYDLPPYTKSQAAVKPDKLGRRYPWGFADPYNADHCDYTRLRDSVFIEWRAELRDLSRTKWYENWRTSRLNNGSGGKQRYMSGVLSNGAVAHEVSTASQSPGGVAVGGALPRVVSGGVV